MLWISDTRYYHASVTHDLLGDQVIVVAHGGRWSKRGRTFSIVVHSDEAAAACLARIGKTRLAHGYRMADQDTVR